MKKGKTVSSSMMGIEKASKSMGKGMSGMMSMPAGRGKMGMKDCPKVSKIG